MANRARRHDGDEDYSDFRDDDDPYFVEDRRDELGLEGDDAGEFDDPDDQADLQGTNGEAR